MEEKMNESRNLMVSEGRYRSLKSESGFFKLIWAQDGYARFLSFANALNVCGQKFRVAKYEENTFYRWFFSKTGIRRFDLTCEADGDAILSCEMVTYPQKDFKERSLERFATLLSTFNFKFKPGKYNTFIHINILNFTAWEDPTTYIHVEQLRTAKRKKHPPEILEVSIELPKFNKRIDELTTDMDKWLFLFKNLSYLKSMPAIYDTPLFKELFKEARLRD